MDLTMDKAKIEFERGLLASAEVVGPDDVGYMVKLVSAIPSDGELYLLDVRRKKPRIFRSLDSATNAVREIGFTLISVRAEV